MVQGGMRITDVTTHHLPGTRYPWVFLVITTENGLTGLGQVSSGPNSAAVAAAASKLAPLLVGEDATRIEYLWHKLFAGFNSLGSVGFVSALISGVDIALWDLRGKSLDVPVYELLGGRFHDEIPLYSNGWFSGAKTPDEFARAAAKTVAEGHTVLKLDPFKGGHAYLSRYAAPYPVEADVEAAAIVGAIREAVGPGVSILIDAHGRFDLPTAIRLATALVPHGIGWFEEPVPPENVSALKQFREAVRVPVCVGERLYTRFEFREILENRLAEYLMPDIVRTGGISEMKKIATMAEAFYIPIAPHDATGPITMAASTQVMATVPNFFRMEIAYSELPQYNAALTPPLDLRDGTYHLPDRPGIGHELRADYIAQAISY